MNSRPVFSTLRHRRNHGFTLVEIMVVVAVIALLSAIVIPNLVRARASSQANACINNLRKIQDACDQYALETGKSTGDHVSLNRDLTPYIKMNLTGRLPACPARGSYSLEDIGDLPTCSLRTTVIPAHVMP